MQFDPSSRQDIRPQPRGLSLSEYPPDSGRAGEISWLALIAAESASGKDDAARAELQRFLATPRSWHSMAEIEKWQPLAANPKLLDGLRRATPES